MNINRNNEIKQKAQGINPSIVARNLDELSDLSTGNIYHSLNIVAKRANQIGTDLKRELSAKLNEFASTTDSLEEVHENKEQIEISKFYERLPNPSIIALHDFYEQKIHFRFKNEDEETF